MEACTRETWRSWIRPRSTHGAKLVPANKLVAQAIWDVKTYGLFIRPHPRAVLVQPASEPKWPAPGYPGRGKSLSKGGTKIVESKARIVDSERRIVESKKYQAN